MFCFVFWFRLWDQCRLSMSKYVKLVLVRILEDTDDLSLSVHP